MERGNPAKAKQSFSEIIFKSVRDIVLGILVVYTFIDFVSKTISYFKPEWKTIMELMAWLIPFSCLIGILLALAILFVVYYANKKDRNGNIQYLTNDDKLLERIDNLENRVRALEDERSQKPKP